MLVVKTVDELRRVLEKGSDEEKEQLNAFFRASMKGLVELESSLLRGRDCYDAPALHVATDYDCLLIFQALVFAGADVNDRCDGDHVLVWAVTSSVAITRYLLQDVLVDRAVISDALYEFCVNAGPTECFELLLEAGADPNALCGPERMPPLHQAAKLGMVRVARLLLENSADVNAVDGHGGDTPLHDAIGGEGTPEVVLLLLQNGGDPCIKNVQGTTPFDEAVSGRMSVHIDPVISMFLEHYKVTLLQQEGTECLHGLFRTATPSTNEQGTPYFELPIGSLRAFDIVSLLTLIVTDNPDSIHARDSFQGGLPIHTAVRTGMPIEVVRFLLEGRPYPLFCINNDGSLPLTVACEHGASLQMLEYLIEQAPTTVRHPNNDRWLPLHALCASQPPYKAVALLLHHYKDGAKSKTSDWDLPIQLACKRGASLDVVFLLLKAHPEAVVWMKRYYNYEAYPWD